MSRQDSDRTDKTRQAFDAAAANFTALGKYLWDPIGAATAAVADPKPGQRVLDACCGAGASAIPAARQVGLHGAVDAVDISASMIAELRRQAADLPQLHAHQTDVTEWDPSGYDIVQSALGIFFLPDMAADTRQLIGKARPGGRAVFTIWRGHAMAAAGRHLGLAVAEATETDPPSEREPHLFDRINQPDAFAEWLAGLGLADVDVVERDMSLPATPDVAWLVVIGSGFRGMLGDLAPDTVQRVRELYLARLREAGVDTLDASTIVGAGTTPLVESH